jgi:hypothetical protein
MLVHHLFVAVSAKPHIAAAGWLLFMVCCCPVMREDEFSCVSCRGFDIGNHFTEYAGFDGDYSR